MTRLALASALLVVAALLLAAPGGRAQRRLPVRGEPQSRRTSAPRGRPAAAGGEGRRPLARGRPAAAQQVDASPGGRLSGVLPRRAAAGVLAGAVLLLVPAPVNVGLAVVVLVVAPPLLARLPDTTGPAHIGGLPLAADLVSAAVACGVPPVLALEVVASAVGDELGAVLGRVAGSLRLGAAPVAAWASALPEPCPAALAALARTAARADEGGTRLAVSLTQLADEERARVVASALDRARRAGVAAVAPLGLCFLPAFLVLGVVPVVVAAAQRLVP